MNEPNEIPSAFSIDEVARLRQSGRETGGLSTKYRASDEQLAFIADVVTKVQDRQGTGDLGTLTPENLRLKHGGGRRLARQIATRISAARDLDAEYDRAIMELVRQAFQFERDEVVFNAIIQRIGEWD